MRSSRLYYYKLEDLDIYGGTTMDGPIDIRAAPAGHRPQLTCELAVWAHHMVALGRKAAW